MYIPIANCQTVDETILDQLSEESLIDNVWVHPTKEFYPREDPQRYKAIAKNWLQIFAAAILKGDEFFMLCNSNRMGHISKIPMMYDYITSNPLCGLVAYNPHNIKKHSRHVAVGMSVIRTEAAKDVKFEMRGEHCGCIFLCNEMRAAKWEVNNVGETVKDKRR